MFRAGLKKLVQVKLQFFNFDSTFSRDGFYNSCFQNPSENSDGSTGPTALESDGPYFEIMGQLPGPTINLKASRPTCSYQLYVKDLHAAISCM